MSQISKTHNLSETELKAKLTEYVKKTEIIPLHHEKVATQLFDLISGKLKRNPEPEYTKHVNVFTRETWEELLPSHILHSEVVKEGEQILKDGLTARPFVFKLKNGKTHLGWWRVNGKGKRVFEDDFYDMEIVNSFDGCCFQVVVLYWDNDTYYKHDYSQSYTIEPCSFGSYTPEIDEDCSFYSGLYPSRPVPCDGYTFDEFEHLMKESLKTILIQLTLPRSNPRLHCVSYDTHQKPQSISVNPRKRTRLERKCKNKTKK